MIQDLAIIFRHTDNLAFNPISSKRAEVPTVNTSPPVIIHHKVMIIRNPIFIP
jgi:hypothetical protein